MIVKLQIEHHLEFLSLKGCCRGSSESTLVKMSNCWISHAAAHMISKCILVSLAVCIGQVFKPHSLAVSIVSPWPEPNIIVASLYVL